MGIIVPAACGLTVLAGRISPGRIATIALPALLLTALGAGTWRQSGTYRDYETLFRETLARNPGSTLVHNNLGTILMLKPGGIPEALAEFEAAVRLMPESPDYRVNLGLALAQMPGRLPNAIAEYQASLNVDPDVPEVHYELAYALAQIPGRVPEAIAACQRMLLLDPGNEAGQKLMASLLAFQDGRGR